MFYRRTLPLLLFAALEIACQKKVQGPPPRYAVLRFENLSGDPSLEWLARAASETLSQSLAGALDGPVLPSNALGRFAPTLGPRPAAAPGISTERTEALLAGATRLITGYVERDRGNIRITATEEDLSSGKSLRIVPAMDRSPLASLSRLSRLLSANSRPLPTSNEDALRAYSTALEQTSGSSVPVLQQAVAMDPRFGSAWVALVAQQLAANDRAGAQESLARARNQKLDAVAAATLDLESATLNPDQHARILAMRKISLLSPADTVLLRSLIEAETAAGEFSAAASDGQRLTQIVPEDITAWNSLGYARAWAGDYAGALAALGEYARLRPTEANPLDSIGDVQYGFSKFKEAEASYLQAYQKQPAFQQGGELYKAAWAKFNEGDKAGADALFSRFRAAREKAADPGLPLLAADWLYRTGRRPEAVSSLRQAAAGLPPAVAANAWSMLAVWDLLAGDRVQAAKDAAIGAPIARFLAQPSASAAEWESRAQRMFPPAMGSVRLVALGYALLLDGKRDAALPVWQQIVKANPATDFFSLSIADRLQGKAIDHPVLPDPTSVNPFAAILEKV